MSAEPPEPLKTSKLDDSLEVILAITAKGCLFTSYRGDPCWDTPEQRRAVFEHHVKLDERLDEARLRVKLFIAMLLDEFELSPIRLARALEAVIASKPPSNLCAGTEFRLWYHSGLEQFVDDLVMRVGLPKAVSDSSALSPKPSPTVSWHGSFSDFVTDLLPLMGNEGLLKLVREIDERCSKGK